MQAPAHLVARLNLFGASRTVGDLMGLCEENYALLLRLAPNLKHLHGRLRSGCSTGADLYLDVLEQAPYTSLIRLTYLFAGSAAGGGFAAPDPDTRLRVYHDAGQAEVLDLRQTVLPLYRHYQSPALSAKWKANLFLSKWLMFCVREGHRFPSDSLCPVSPPGLELTPSF